VGGNLSTTGSLSGASLGVSGNVTANNVAALSNVSGATGTFSGALSAGSLSLSGALTVPNGGTGLTSGTSGGIPYFSSSSTMTSSATLASAGLVLGGGAGATPSTSADFTTASATNSATVNVGKSGTGTANTGDLGSLFLGGSTSGGPTLASQAIGGSLTLQLPNTAPTTNQVLTATAVNSNTVTLGFTTPNAGTITNVIAGTDLTGGGNSGAVTLNVDTTKVPTLAASNAFAGTTNTFVGITASGTVTANSFSGSGSGLTGLNASQLTTGTVPSAALSGNYNINITGSAASATNFTGNLAGDVTGTQGTTTVSKIQGTAVSGTTGSGNVVFSASPALTGTPTAPTAAAGTNNTQLATTAYVNNPNDIFSGVNAQTATSYTVTAADQGKLVTIANAAAESVILPATPPPTGWWIDFENTGAGTATVSPNGLRLDGSLSGLALTTNQGIRIVSNGANYFSQRGLANSSNFSGTLAVANGGTGQTTAQAAINALTGTQAAGKYLRSDGTNATLSSIQAADVPTLNQNTTGSAGSFTGNLGGDVTGTQSATVVSKINNTTLGTLTGATNGQVLAWDGTNNRWAPATVISNGGIAGGQITITTTQVPSLAKTTCTTTDPSFTFTGATNTMAIVITPAGTLHAGDWDAAGLTWVPYVSPAGTVKVHVCNGSQSAVTFTASQTFNARFIN
jgi:hypothetical protein